MVIFISSISVVTNCSFNDICYSIQLSLRQLILATLNIFTQHQISEKKEIDKIVASLPTQMEKAFQYHCQTFIWSTS